VTPHRICPKIKESRDSSMKTAQWIANLQLYLRSRPPGPETVRHTSPAASEADRDSGVAESQRRRSRTSRAMPPARCSAVVSNRSRLPA
jgi:hypothetical protein